MHAGDDERVGSVASVQQPITVIVGGLITRRERRPPTQEVRQTGGEVSNQAPAFAFCVTEVAPPCGLTAVALPTLVAGGPLRVVSTKAGTGHRVAQLRGSAVAMAVARRAALRGQGIAEVAVQTFVTELALGTVKAAVALSRPG